MDNNTLNGTAYRRPLAWAFGVGENMKYVTVLCACLLLCGCASHRQEATAVSRTPVASDASSGTSLYLDDSAQILTAESRDGKTLWSANVIKECGVPAVGEPKVRSVSVQMGKVNVVFGKHSFATVDLKSGRIEYQGAD